MKRSVEKTHTHTSSFVATSATSRVLDSAAAAAVAPRRVGTCSLVCRADLFVHGLPVTLRYLVAHHLASGECVAVAIGAAVERTLQPD